jgi:hypothetical protein
MSAVVTSAVVAELQEQLLAWERELDYTAGAIAAWEDELVAFEHALKKACMERDVERA